MDWLRHQLMESEILARRFNPKFLLYRSLFSVYLSLLRLGSGAAFWDGDCQILNRIRIDGSNVWAVSVEEQNAAVDEAVRSRNSCGCWWIACKQRKTEDDGLTNDGAEKRIGVRIAGRAECSQELPQKILFFRILIAGIVRCRKIRPELTDAAGNGWSSQYEAPFLQLPFGVRQTPRDWHFFFRSNPNRNLRKASENEKEKSISSPLSGVNICLGLSVVCSRGSPPKMRRYSKGRAQPSPREGSSTGSVLFRGAADDWPTVRVPFWQVSSSVARNRRGRLGGQSHCVY